MTGRRWLRMRAWFIARGFSAPDRRLGQLGAVLLKAGQNGEIALIDHRAAEALNVARAGLLLVRRAAACCWAMAPVETEIDNRVRAKKNLRIVFLHSHGRIPSRAAHGMNGTDYSDCRCRKPQQRANQKRWQMRPNLRRPATEYAVWRRISMTHNQLIFKRLFP